MNIGDAVVLPFDEAATDLDVRRITGIVVAVGNTTVTTIDGYGVKCDSPIDGVHMLAPFARTLEQFTQKGVELVDKAKPW